MITYLVCDSPNAKHIVVVTLGPVLNIEARTNFYGRIFVGTFVVEHYRKCLNKQVSQFSHTFMAVF